jgi:hypothetical protein
VLEGNLIDGLYAHSETLFTFRVFERMAGDYFIFQNFLDRLFTSPDFEGIIPDIYTNPLHSSVFLARLKTIHHDRVFFGI